MAALDPAAIATASAVALPAAVAPPAAIAAGIAGAARWRTSIEALFPRAPPLADVTRTSSETEPPPPLRDEVGVRRGGSVGPPATLPLPALADCRASREGNAVSLPLNATVLSSLAAMSEPEPAVAL